MIASVRLRYVSFFLVMICSNSALHAQQPSAEPMSTLDGWVIGTAGIGYPAIANGGATIVFGKDRPPIVPGRSRSIRGFKLNADVGLAAVSARVGWAALTDYDAGYSGWSLELVYLTPWSVNVGPEHGDSYLGPGVTRHFGWFRVSGAAVVNLSGSGRRVTPVIDASVVFPLR
jgi:hypothetical protein